MTKMYFRQGEKISGSYQSKQITLEKFDTVLNCSQLANTHFPLEQMNSRYYLLQLLNLIKILCSHPIRFIVFIILFPLFLVLFLLFILMAIITFFQAKEFLFAFFHKDNIYYEGFYLPDYIVFSDSENFAGSDDDSYNYYIAKIDQQLYLKKLRKGSVPWDKRSDLYLDVTDPAAIKRIENSFLVLFDMVNRKKQDAKSKQTQPVKPDEERSLNEQEKQRLMSLASYCLGEKGLAIFKEKLDTYMTGSIDPYWSAIYDLMVSFNEDDFHFATQLDWKEGVDTLEYCVERAVRFNFGESISLPTQANYDEMDSISSNKQIFSDFKTILAGYGLKLGCIDTESDEYIIIVYKIVDEDAVIKATDDIGYRLTDPEIEVGL